MPHACALFAIGVVIGYVLRGILDKVNTVIGKEFVMD
jgi:hypothetical protein